MIFLCSMIFYPFVVFSLECKQLDICRPMLRYCRSTSLFRRSLPLGSIEGPMLIYHLPTITIPAIWRPFCDDWCWFYEWISERISQWERYSLRSRILNRRKIGKNAHSKEYKKRGEFVQNIAKIIAAITRF